VRWISARRRVWWPSLGELIPGADLVVQPGAGHYPWLDDAAAFTAAVAAFLTGPGT
jgi:pimeloyl-ACP methyl ester carboxylesterase